MTWCGQCGGELPPEGAKFCSHCGQPQSQIPPTAHGRKPHELALPAAGPDAWSDTTVAAGSMPVLHVQNGLAARTVTLAGETVTIGRDPANTVVLAEPAVEARHARIEQLPSGGHRIVDDGSRAGTLLHGERIRSHDLVDGDVLRIVDPQSSTLVTLTYINAAAAPPTAPPEAGRRRIALGPDVAALTLGRPGADVPFDSPQVSRRHARIERDATGRHLLRDLGSTNGTYVNGRRVERAVALKTEDVIQVGPFKLRYDGAALEETDEGNGFWIEARSLRREVRDARGGRRVILDDVSLSIRPREFVAFVGGSGAGKSTLLTALAGYAPADRGAVYLNGDNYYENIDVYRASLGYVPQDDIVHRMLPAERALRYAARLRLPSDTAPEEIARRVDRVLAAVEMTAHRHTPIENLSGGQRKRISIAVELLSDPSLIFLDEPTSGLDPHLERKMMFTLRRLADSGRTVVLVTHATANIMQCDHVAFMAHGRMVYFGPPSEALAFFHVTSGDFAEIYARLEGPAEADSPLVQNELADEYARYRREHPTSTAPPALADLWHARFVRSPQHQRYVADRLARPRPSTEDAVAQPRAADPARAAGGYSPLRQFGILAQRYVDLILRDRRNLAMLLLQAPIIGALLCLVSDRDVLATGRAPYDAKKLLFMLATVGVWFGIINGAREICKESSIFQRERFANLRVVPYAASKFFVLLALVFTQSALLLGVVNLKVRFPAVSVLTTALGINPESSSSATPVLALEMFATTALAGSAGVAIGLLISAASATPDKAISAVPLALIPQILFAGLLFKLEGATRVLSWLTASRWAMDAFGATIDLNGFRWAEGTRVQAEGEYANTVGNLLGSWAVLVLYAAVCMNAVVWMLRRRDGGATR